jgi:fucose permease
MEAKPSSKTWAFYPMMIVPGIALLLAPSLVETIMKYFHFHESLGGLLQVAYFAGGVPGILLITRLMQRFDVRQIALSQVALLSASLLAASFAPCYPLLLAFFVIAGFANGILIAFPGVYVTRVAGDSSHGAQNILYSFFSLGVVAGPLMTALIINDRVDMWRWALRAPALLILPLSVPVALVTFERLEMVKKLSRDTMREVMDFGRGLFCGLFLAILLYIAAESAVSMWLITFLKEEHDVGVGAAHWTLTGLWAGLTVGRWICGYLTRKFDPYNVLVFLAIASGVTLLAAPLTGSTVAALVMYPLIGLFYSGIYPILIGYAAWFPPDISSAVFTVFLAAGAAGGAVLPYLVGLVNQFGGLVIGMCSISIPVFGVVACLYWLRRHVLEHAPNTAVCQDI